MKKKSKTSKTAKTTKSTKKITKSAKKVMVKPSIIETIEPKEMAPLQATTATIEKLPWEIVNEGFNFFSYAFQPDGFEDESGNFIVDDRFTAIWKSFLCISGWTEDQFWKETHEHPDGECPECKAEREEKEKQAKLKNVN